MIADLKESEEDYSSFNRNDFRPFLYQHFNYRDIINDRIKQGVITETRIDKKFENASEIGKSSIKAEEDYIQNLKEFENYLASLISHLSFLNMQSYGVHEYINTLLITIEKELKPNLQMACNL